MSIKPIDMKMVVHKTQEVSKMERDCQQKQSSELQSQIFVQQKKFEKELNRVNSSKGVEKNGISNDKKDKNNNEQNLNKEKDSGNLQNNKNNDNKDSKKIKETIGTNIDIKI